MAGTFGSRLATARKEKKLTMQQVADHLGIARTTYSGYESNYREPDTETIAKLSELLDTTTDYLITGETSTQSEDPSIPPEEREFLKWVKEQVSDSFFYDWDKDPDERKSDYIKGLRLIYELEKDRKPGQRQGE